MHGAGDPSRRKHHAHQGGLASRERARHQVRQTGGSLAFDGAEPPQGHLLVCGERRRWEQEKVKGSLEAESAGKPRFTVLLDQPLVAPDLDTLVRRVPNYFAVRRAVRPVTAEDFANYGRGLHEWFAASLVRSGSQAYSWNMAPDVTVTANPAVVTAGGMADAASKRSPSSLTPGASRPRRPAPARSRPRALRSSPRRRRRFDSG